MECKSCKTENAPGMGFCKKCGKSLDPNMVKCVNGHDYDASFATCPYCPRKDNARTIVDAQAPTQTVVEREKGEPRRHGDTVIDIGKPSLTRPDSSMPGSRPSSVKRDDKTVIYPGPSVAGGAPVGVQGSRKLVGWLVTYDLQPSGTDYRLYEGRTKIGRSSENDVIVNADGVSDKHCLLLYRDKKFLIKDELSTNGTIVNGQSIEENVHLNDNDEIRIGKVTLKLKVI